MAGRTEGRKEKGKWEKGIGRKETMDRRDGFTKVEGMNEDRKGKCKTKRKEGRKDKRKRGK